MAPESLRPTAAHVDLDLLAENFHSAKAFIGPDVNYLAVIKGDAYGHGAVECGLRLEAESVDWFGVALPEEGVQLRDAGIATPILCLGSFWDGQEELLVNHRLTPVVCDLASAQRLSQFGAKNNRKIDAHIKIDTGMRRLGIDWERAAGFAEELKGLSNFTVTGLMTHFASADDPAEDAFTALQIARFNDACDAFRDAGHQPEYIDLANSPGAIGHPESRANMVRLGGTLYGLLDDILSPGTARPALMPIMSLRSRIAHVRKVPAGESLGYGRTYATSRESLIATVPIGYADGYSRGLSNRAVANVKGRLAPVVGRVSMDWTLLDVTDIPDVGRDDDVFLIGGEAPNDIKAADLAAHLGTIGYEITCGISSRVPRTYSGSRRK